MCNLGQIYSSSKLPGYQYYMFKIQWKKNSKEIQAIICCKMSDISCCVPTKLLSMYAAVKLPSSGYNRYHYSYPAKLSPAKKMQHFLILPKLEKMITKDELLYFYPAPQCVF